MPAAGRPDVLIVSLSSTTGLALADADLAGSLRRAGASVELARAAPPGQVRTLMLTDLAWARAARQAARKALRAGPPGAIIYSTTTAALLWPAPGAIRFDAPAAGNRPGWHGLWQRPVERRRLGQAQLLLPLSEGGLHEAGLGGSVTGRALVLPLAVEPSGPPEPERDITAIIHAGNPMKKGLDRVLAAWRTVIAARGGQDGAGLELVVAGASPGELESAGIDLGEERGVRDVGRLPAEDYRALLRRSRMFLCAPRREDYGAAQLEALADGCLLVTTPAPGPYAALGIARELDDGLVGEDLAGALDRALGYSGQGDYAERALRALAPYRAAAVDQLVADQLLPRLLGGGPAA
jgi:Glycosyl transferases group 1